MNKVFEISKNANLNYLCQIVKIYQINPIEGADNLCTTIVQGNIVVVNKSVSPGDIMIYFPVECQIQDWYLKKNNLYRESTNNNDPTKKGFIENNGRVRCIKLRNQPSQGLLMPILSLGDGSDWDIDKNIEGKEFDTFNNKLIIRKYTTPTKEYVTIGNKVRKCKTVSKVIDTQFRFHIDTPQFGKNINYFNPDDIISITRKVHGTSGISSYVICNKPVKKATKFVNLVANACWGIINLFNKPKGESVIHDSDYDYIYSSRRVVKNGETDGFYKVDVWKYADEIIKHYLIKGMTMYYEIIGYLPDGKMIQKDYSYGFEKPNGAYIYGVNFGIQVYRITMTNEDGDVVEYSSQMVQNFCKERKLVAVKQYYYGKACSLYSYKMDMGIENWRNGFLELLRDEYLEKNANDCGKNVPDEGIVIRKESLGIDVYKFKSYKFLQKETKELDLGTENIEG